VNTASDLADGSSGSVAELTSLIEGLRAARNALPDGPLDLPALERAGAAAPPNLVRGRRLVSFSGPMFLMKSGSRLTIDLFAFPRALCQQLLQPISSLPGVVRIAVTATLADERSGPISQAQAQPLCAQNTRQLRIIVDLWDRS
jgi:hypothetical protein